uniref:Uncharacterized protein n=1 Tax=Ditylenchus dipsaci TaxID=166011 RepID=A0A915CT65_9BILA
MDQRPPSSRPKTSSGRPGSSRRPKTAGRDGERPPTRQLPVRPPSRIGVDAINSDNVAISERAISRGNPMNPPTSAMAMRTMSRNNQRPPSTSMRPGTGLNQQYFPIPQELASSDLSLNKV